MFRKQKEQTDVFRGNIEQNIQIERLEPVSLGY